MFKKLLPGMMGIFALSGAIVSCSDAWAQATTTVPHTWVSYSGTDGGTCPISAPCASFSYAISQTSAGGEVTCLTSGAFGGPAIFKSIVINCAGTLASPGIDNSGGNFFVNTSSSDRVVLRGLDSEPGASSYAIQFYGAGTLVLDQVKATGSSNNGGFALDFRPTGAGRLVVTDSLFTNGGVSTGAGIVIRPQSAGTAQVMLERVTVAANAFGIAVDGSSSTGGINVTIKDSSMASNSQDGVVATSSASTAPIGVTVINSASINNGYGIRSIGSNVTVRVQGSQIIGNGTGLSGGGALLSGGGNTVQANATNGGFTGSYALQ